MEYEQHIEADIDDTADINFEKVVKLLKPVKTVVLKLMKKLIKIYNLFKLENSRWNGYIIILVRRAQQEVKVKIFLILFTFSN